MHLCDRLCIFGLKPKTVDGVYKYEFAFALNCINIIYMMRL